MDDYCMGERIRSLRAQLRISQENLALKAGITPVYLGQIERGEKNPTIKVIEKISGAFGLALSEFFKEENPLSSEDPKNAAVNGINMERKILFELRGFSEEEKEGVLVILQNINKLRNIAKGRQE